MSEVRNFEGRIISLQRLMNKPNLRYLQNKLVEIQKVRESIRGEKEYMMEELAELRQPYQEISILCSPTTEPQYEEYHCYLPETRRVVENLMSRDRWRHFAYTWADHKREPVKELFSVHARSAELKPTEYPEPVKGYTLLSEWKELQQAIEKDLESIYFFQLSAEEERYYSEKMPFGPMVKKVFPAATEDILEAAKCLAVERYVSSVFHTYRAVECGVHLLAKRLKVPLVVVNKRGQKLPRGWGQLASLMMDKIGKKSEHRYFPGIKDLIRVARLRNDIDHAHKGKTSSRSFEEAKEVFEEAKRFMQDLALLMSK